MASLRSLLVLSSAAGLAFGQCPYGHQNERRQAPAPAAPAPPTVQSTEDFLGQFTVSSNGTLLTTDAGGYIDDQASLKAGVRGPTLLEDFILRQKITHFDHERVPERAVHARGAGAHGVFESYADWSNITAASFLRGAGKQTPIFVRFSTVAGSRGSSDTARDVHGFATRFYTDEGNFDIVGNNIPVFFVQDAIQFPDLIHAVKPQPNNEIPQAATAHDTAWDYFSQQPSTLHTLFWAMAGHGIPRSYRHLDGFGVHTYRFVRDNGESRFVKFHKRTLQGKASLTWEEAQQAYGKNPDYHREDLYNAISKGQFPQWEFGVQVFSEDDATRFGFDVLDPTKFVPEELVPITPLGRLTLNRNPTNYFAEVEQVMFQPGHIIRGVDFSEDPLLQGRIFSYLDTQINRHGGPNFEQLPINQPRVPVNNNNRDGAAQFYIHNNVNAYTPNSASSGPRQASTQGRAFASAPNRTATGRLVRQKSSTFEEYYNQPRLFYNSLLPQEQQFLINAMRFETSKLTNPLIKQNVLNQLVRIDRNIARQVAQALGLNEPASDGIFYHNNRTTGVSVFERPLPAATGLTVGILTSVDRPSSQVNFIKAQLLRDNINVVVVGESLRFGIDMTYSAADSTNFDGVIVVDGTGNLFNNNIRDQSTLYPPGRPLQIVVDSYRFGKALGFIDDGIAAFGAANIQGGPGVFTLTTRQAPSTFINNGGSTTNNNGEISTGFSISKRANASIAGKDAASADAQFPNGFGNGFIVPPIVVSNMASTFRTALRTFRFLNRFPVDRSR